MFVGRFDVLPLLRLLLERNPKPLISALQQTLDSIRTNMLDCLVGCETNHQFRGPQRNRISSVNLPEMIHFAIQRHYVVHFCRLGPVPECIGHLCKFPVSAWISLSPPPLPTPACMYGTSVQKRLHTCRGRHDQHPAFHLVFMCMP